MGKMRMGTAMNRVAILSTEKYPMLNLFIPREYTYPLYGIFPKSIKGVPIANNYRMFQIKVGSTNFYKTCFPSLISMLEVNNIPYVFDKNNTLFYDPQELLLHKESLKGNEMKLEREWIDKYHAFEELYPHQYFGVEKVFNRLQYGLFFEMRTGKTITVLIGLSLLAFLGYIGSVFIVTPYPAIQNAWVKEITRNLKYPTTYFQVTSKTTLPQLTAFLTRAREENKLPIFIFHYEYFITKSFKNHFVPFITKNYLSLKAALVLDESHRIKNPSSKRFKNLSSIGYVFKRFYLLSGTPLGNSIEDIWTQSIFIGLQHVTGFNISSFRRKFMIPHPAGFGYLPKANSVKKLKEHLKTVSIFVKQSSVFKDVKIFREPYSYVLTNEQRRVYDQLKEELAAKVENGEITVAKGLAQSIKLAQVCSGFLSDTETKKVYRLNAENRIKLLDELLRDIDGNVVLWHEFNYDIEILSAVLSKKIRRPFYVIQGSNKKEERAKILEKWEKDSGAVLITKPSLLGEGMDLSKAEVAIYWNHNYSYINRFQSESRILTKGKSVVILMSLYAPNTIESSILKILEKGKSVDDTIKENNFYSFLTGDLS